MVFGVKIHYCPISVYGEGFVTQTEDECCMRSNKLSVL